MREAIHIFRKDVRALWPQIAIALAAAAACPLIRDDQSADKITGLLVLTRWYLVVCAVHQEKLVGYREWWFTRPYSWRSLLGAKLLLIAAFVQLPLLLSDLAILTSNGLPIGWARLAVRQIQLLLALILPAAAVAVLTPGLISAALAILAILIAIVIPGANDIQIARWGPLMWIPPVLLITVLGIVSTLVLLWQYRRHQTVPAAGALGGAAIICGAFFLLPPGSWGLALAMHSSDAARGLRLEVNQDKSPSIAPASQGKVRISIPIRVTGLPQDMLVQPELVHFGLHASDGARLDTGWQAVSDYFSNAGWAFSDPRHAGVSYAFAQGAFDRLRGQRLSYKVSIILTVLGREHTDVVNPVNGEYVVPGFAVCTPESGIVYDRQTLICRSGQPPPHQVVADQAAYLYPHPGDMSAISLTPSPLWIGHMLLPPDWKGPPITFYTRTSIARVERELTGEILPENLR